MQKYELYIIFDQNTSSETCDELLKGFLDEINAENVNIDREGVKKFAYPIKKHNVGLYYLVDFDLDLTNTTKINGAMLKFNKKESILRYICVNQTDFIIQKSKEKLNQNPEFTNHRDLNKGKGADKQCLLRYLGYRAVDYKDVDFISQFTSPYAKMFGKDRTGVSSKYQRKVSQAIKRARHMGLMPFTSKWMDN